ncbi:hypothetical protein SAMN04489724_2315 [Algoriphagus locisalis]|uniref:Uncharacterized protein n=1 Tax=Algoriphagus locisalis TaxID=305507 RepID=A0A1I7BDD8_9BACT|nr:hypothetical protein SAMN04489724_2315 [Algoriphagus locisalis]
MFLGSCSKEYKKVDGVILDVKAVNGPKGIGFRSVYKFQYFDSFQLDTIEVMDKRVYLFPGDSIQIEIDPMDKLDHSVLKILYRTPRHY